jgi:hypothetical protein
MPIRNRLTSSLSALAVAVVGLAACAGGSSGAIVAQVAGVGSISKPTLEHWMPVEAIVLYQEKPTKPVPRGVIPDPPLYNACIAFLESSAAKPAESAAKPAISQLRSRCAHKETELKEITLNTLIGWYWTIGAGKALGLKASDAEVRQRLVEVNKRSYATPAEFTSYLKLTKQTLPDMLFRTRVQLFEVKLREKLAALEKDLPTQLTAQQRQGVVGRFLESVGPGKKWAAKTTCSKGYVVSACKEYRGSNFPGLPN